jgi:hypothetical protein
MEAPKKRNTLFTVLVGLILVFAIIGVVSAGANAGFINSNLLPSQAPSTGVGPSPNAVPKTLVVEMRADNPAMANQSGTATLTDLGDGTTRVDVDVNPAGIANPQPAHIHMGGCPGVGQVVYPLNDVVNGKSTTVISTTMQNLFSQRPLALNVHLSAADISTYTSCGDITQ